MPHFSHRPNRDDNFHMTQLNGNQGLLGRVQWMLVRQATAEFSEMGTFFFFWKSEILPQWLEGTDPIVNLYTQY